MVIFDVMIHTAVMKKEELVGYPNISILYTY